MNILVIGGTRFVGKRLVEMLVGAGESVTVVTRGKAPVNPAARHISCDRSKSAEIIKILNDDHYDLVYDTVAYAPDDVFDICTALRDTESRYVSVSSQMVYEPAANLNEADFDWRAVTVRRGTRQQFSYADGKRMVESIILSQVPESVCVRFPVILGPDDYTRRLHSVIDACVRGVPVYVTDLLTRFSLVDSYTASSALFRLRSEPLVRGGLNVASRGTVSAGEFLELVRQVASHSPSILSPCTDEMDILHCPATRILSVEKYERSFGAPSVLEDWLPILIQNIFGEMQRELRHA